MFYSRRQFGKLALSGAGVLLVAPPALAQTRPNSVIDGIQIGTMVPNSLRGVPVDLYAYRDVLVKIGLSGCECHNEPFELFAGAPKPTAKGFPGLPPGQIPQGPPPAGFHRPPPSPEEIAARKADQAVLTKWRLSVPTSKFVEGRKIWNDAGISLYAFKIPLNLDMPDAEYDYAFNTGHLLGASMLTMELPSDPALSARVGKFAEKHKMMVGYHAERPMSSSWWDTALAQSPYNSMNLDVGHYVGSGNTDTLEFIKKNHNRISSMHLKDYTRDNKSMPWGQGDTPIIPVLHMIRDQKWTFPVTIELDYPVPANSTMPDEVAKCYTYIRAALRS
jgi:hypothetical protein